jgi:hypothetical protein
MAPRLLVLAAAAVAAAVAHATSPSDVQTGSATERAAALHSAPGLRADAPCPGNTPTSTVLALNKPRAGTILVPPGTPRGTLFKYYTFSYTPGSVSTASFLVTVTSTSGDPDLYISQLCQAPNQTVNAWAR